MRTTQHVHTHTLDAYPTTEDLRGPIRNSGGGYVNHSAFWKMMGPGKGGEPSGALAEAIKAKWGSFDDFKTKFSTAATGLFGSGWAWLYVNKNASPAELVIGTTPNQDTPAMETGKVPVLGLDLWEHAYYLKYQSRRGEYVDAWWSVVNWDEVQARFEEATA